MNPCDAHDIVNAQQCFHEEGESKPRMKQISEFFKIFDPEGILSNSRLRSQRANIIINKGYQNIQRNHNNNPERVNLQDELFESWPHWNDIMSTPEPESLFVDTTGRDNPFFGIPGQGGVQWSEGMDIINEAFPDYEPSAPDQPSGALRVINETFPDYIPETRRDLDDARQLSAHGDKAANDLAQGSDFGGSDFDQYPPTPGRCTSPSLGDDVYHEPAPLVTRVSLDSNAPYPPTPGFYSDGDDIIMDDAEPADPSIVSPEVHGFPEKTVGFERVTKKTNTVHAVAGSDDQPFKDNAGFKDFVTKGSKVPAAASIEGSHPQYAALMGEGTNLRHSENTQSSRARRLLPRFPYSNDVKFSGLDNAVANSIEQESPPQTPPRHKTQLQKSTVPSPLVAHSPTKVLPKAAQMAMRRPSFDRDQEASTNKVSNPEGMSVNSKATASKKSRKSSILAKPDEDLLDDFEFQPRVKLEKMKVPEIKNLIRGIQSLRQWFHGCGKASMIDHLVHWQENMRTKQAARAKEIMTTAGAEPANEKGKAPMVAEEDSDPDADAADDDFSDSMDPYSSPNGNLITRLPLKSPFVDQPILKKQTTLMGKFIKAAAKPSGSSPIPQRKRWPRSTVNAQADIASESTSEDEIGLKVDEKSWASKAKKETDSKSAKYVEAEEHDGFLKRSMRSVSRPASYKESDNRQGFRGNGPR